MKYGPDYRIKQLCVKLGSLVVIESNEGDQLCCQSLLYYYKILISEILGWRVHSSQVVCCQQTPASINTSVQHQEDGGGGWVEEPLVEMLSGTIS